MELCRKRISHEYKFQASIYEDKVFMCKDVHIQEKHHKADE